MALKSAIGMDSKFRRGVFLKHKFFYALNTGSIGLALLCVTMSPGQATAQDIGSPYQAPPQTNSAPEQTAIPKQDIPQTHTRLRSLPQPPPVFGNMMQPSPLSLYSADQGGVMNQIDKVNGTQLLNRGEALFTRKVDMGPVLRKYAALKNCSLNDAFVQATDFLRLTPRDLPREESISSGAFYQIADKDVLQITGPAKFFERLPEQLKCIENGIRHIEMKILFVTIPVEHKTNVHRWLVPNTHTAFNNRLPIATPLATSATSATYKDEAAQRESGKDRGTLVVSSETVTKAYPTFMARLDSKGVEGFLTYIKASDARVAKLSPTIRLVPGTPAAVTDGATRPFVVGIKRIEGDFTVAHQPLVQPVEDGTHLKVRASSENGKIRLDGDLALSTIESVETYIYDEARVNDRTTSAVTIQIPEHRLKQVHISTLVEEGKTVFVEAFGPTTVHYRKDKRPLELEGKVASRKVRTMILLTPKWVGVDHQKTSRLNVKKR